MKFVSTLPLLKSIFSLNYKPMLTLFVGFESHINILQFLANTTAGAADIRSSAFAGTTWKPARAAALAFRNNEENPQP